MKKLSLMIAALALVLGLSQCKKQEKSVANGEKQHIVLTTGHGNDGSKISGLFNNEVLSLKWDGTEEITVTGALKGTLKTITIDPSDPSRATFEDDVDPGEGDKVTFTCGNIDLNYYNQDGSEESMKNFIHSSGVTCTTDVVPSGEYSADLNLPYAVLKLDVSAIVEDGSLDIISDDRFLANVEVTPANCHALFVAIPVAKDAGEVEYTFGGYGRSVNEVIKSWNLEPGVFYTAKGADGKPTGEAIVIKPIPVFSVGPNTTVEFAPGNLYWDGSVFKFEANQWSFASSWDANHVSHFYWSKDASFAYAKSYLSSGATDDVFFTNNTSFQVSGETAGTWRTLTNDEWSYLIGDISPRSTSLRSWSFVELDADGTYVWGLIIMPDGWEGTLGGDIDYDTWQALESSGAVFLPVAGQRYDTMFNFDNSVYWSSTPDDDDEALNAYILDLYSVDVYPKDRAEGCSVRLVRNVE